MPSDLAPPSHSTKTSERSESTWIHRESKIIMRYSGYTEMSMECHDRWGQDFSFSIITCHPCMVLMVPGLQHWHILKAPVRQLLKDGELVRALHHRRSCASPRAAWCGAAAPVVHGVLTAFMFATTAIIILLIITTTTTTTVFIGEMPAFVSCCSWIYSLQNRRLLLLTPSFSQLKSQFLLLNSELSIFAA